MQQAMISWHVYELFQHVDDVNKLLMLICHIFSIHIKKGSHTTAGRMYSVTFLLLPG